MENPSTLAYTPTKGALETLVKNWAAILGSRGIGVNAVAPSKGREIKLAKTTPDQNKTTVLEAFDTLFNKRDYATAERFWLPNYIQHSAHFAPGRKGLLDSHQKHPTTVEVRTGNGRS